MDRQVDAAAEEQAEKMVADEIEKAIAYPASIEEAELLDAAELEEIEFRSQEA